AVSRDPVASRTASILMKLKNTVKDPTRSGAASSSVSGMARTSKSSPCLGARLRANSPRILVILPILQLIAFFTDDGGRAKGVGARLRDQPTDSSPRTLREHRGDAVGEHADRSAHAGGDLAVRGVAVDGDGLGAGEHLAAAGVQQRPVGVQ